MQFCHLPTMVALCVVLAGQFAPASAQAERDVYHGVTLLDPASETVTPDAYIIVEGGYIRDIGQGEPPMSGGASNLHDFSGLYALPGLIDTHAHITLGPVRLVTDDGSPYLEAIDSPDVVAHRARVLLAFGITTIRNPGGDTLSNAGYSRAVSSGELPGPEALNAGAVIDRTPVPFHGLVVRPTGEHGIRQIVREQSKASMDYVKLYEGLSQTDLAEGIAAAHTHGMKAIGHLGDVSWTTAARLGIDALVHMMPTSPDLLPSDQREDYLSTRRPGAFAFFEWYEAVLLSSPEIETMIEELARRQVHLDATLVAFRAAFWGDDQTIRDADMELVHPAMLQNWRSGFRFDLGWTANDYSRAKAVWPKVVELTRRLHDAGVPMTIGTDLANPFVAPGASMGREMALHQQAGIPSWSILRMATSGAATILGIGHRTGFLKPAYEADILFVHSDPRLDVSAVSDVAAVLNNGVLLSPEKLLAAD